ncbi:MAG: tRNA (adenosine(37)-N6)-threonylcarbamoyltransferase complex ATPase subunit type 1 TsaE [Coriobacteriales bacterium]
MSETFTSASVEETLELGRRLSLQAEPDSCYVLTGDLGAGKTHFSKGFAAGLGVTEQITSPTFAIVERYDSGRLPLLHWDLYRLESEWELEDVDWYGLTECGAVSLVEWGDKFPDALPEGCRFVDVRVREDGTRLITLS